MSTFMPKDKVRKEAAEKRAAKRRALAEEDHRSCARCQHQWCERQRDGGCMFWANGYAHGYDTLGHDDDIRRKEKKAWLEA